MPERGGAHARRARGPARARCRWQEAVFNVAHAALLTLGLARGDWDLLARGLQDRLHQQRRSHLFPRSYELAAPRPRARRARRDDLRRRARRCWCGASTSRPAPSPRRSRGEIEGWASCCARLLRAAGRLRGGALSDCSASFARRLRAAPRPRQALQQLRRPARGSRRRGRGGGRGSSGPARPTRRRRSRRG